MLRLHLIPDLSNQEADIMDQEFKIGLIDFLKNADTSPQTISIRNLPLLAAHIQTTVQAYLNKKNAEG